VRDYMRGHQTDGQVDLEKIKGGVSTPSLSMASLGWQVANPCCACVCAPGSQDFKIRPLTLGDFLVSDSAGADVTESEGLD